MSSLTNTATERIVLCFPAESQHVRQIEATLEELGVAAEIVNAGQERIAAELPSATIYCGHAKVPVPWAETVAAGRLKWIQSTAAGMDHCLVPEVIASDIMVSSASGVLANQVADHTFALLFSLVRSLPVFFRAQQKKEFIRIVGLGGNGRRLVEVLRPFHCRILATDWFPEDKPEGVEALLPADRLDEILPEIDVLILAAPLNAMTRHLIDARRLALLPKGALLINMARGPIVDEAAMIDALESGHLGGVGVDVTEVEPLPVESRLWEQPNAIITPHVGGQVATRVEDVTDFFCANLVRYFRGETLLNLLADKRLGFPRPEHAAWRR
jgi:phosphoglycerate dehydrogenase-like enzyme